MIIGVMFLNKNQSFKIAFVSLGCDKNLVDSEIMLGIIQEEGYTIISDSGLADIVIVNTCGFILDATEEGIENVLQIAEFKKSGVCKGLIVTGCMAQRYKKEIFEDIKEVDAVVGTGDFESIGKVIKEVLEGNKVELVTDINNKLNEKNSFKRVLTTPSYISYLKIAEGCDNSCTYCTIPSLRGKYRSRTIESLVEETTILAKQGVKELVIIAQDTALYGTDIYDGNMLHVLLNKLSGVDGIEWIRMLYCYPEHITDETIIEMSKNEKVCHYIDMPIQHSEDKILKLMGRGNSKAEIKKVIEKLRNYMPDIIIRTTLIVGFPAESEDDFNNLMDFVKEIKFNKLGVFPYSQEEGTPAAKLPNQIDDDIKNERKDKIMEQQKYISAEILKEQTGKVIKVVVEGKMVDDEIYCGRSYMDCYDIDGLVFFDSEMEVLSGEFLNILITDALDYDLIGEII